METTTMGRFGILLSAAEAMSVPMIETAIKWSERRGAETRRLVSLPKQVSLQTLKSIT